LMSNNTTSLTLTTDLSIAYSAILTMAVLPIYIGSHISLHLKFNKSPDEREEDKILTPKDAYMFPLIASGFLFGLYIIFKMFSKEYVNLLLTTYISLVGIYSVLETTKPILKFLLPQLDVNPQTINVNIPYYKKEFKLTTLDYINLVLALSILGWYLSTKYWVANNLLAFCFSIQGIARIQIGSYKVCCILLSGLFFYDIFWVFGTDVMVTVAKSFDAPIKFLFPKAIFTAGSGFSMLGLGDIVLPGVFIAFLLRYDHFRVFKDESQGTSIFKKTYFTNCFVGYFIGLATTIFVMHTFQAAQPALLYLTPACIITSFLTGIALSDVNNLLSYSEEPKDKKE